jgi:hypothetical protein
MAQSKKVKNEPLYPLAADVFTDREDARRVLHLFFEGLLMRPFSESKPIKVFYGAGGSGKTALQKKSINDFHMQMSDQGGYL